MYICVYCNVETNAAQFINYSCQHFYNDFDLLRIHYIEPTYNALWTTKSNSSEYSLSGCKSNYYTTHDRQHVLCYIDPCVV